WSTPIRRSRSPIHRRRRCRRLASRPEEHTMKEILVTWGSKYGGTEGIARMLGESLEARGKSVVTLMPATEVYDLHRFDAVIIGGALYANRWHKDARRFVTRHLRELRRVPVWMFSSGPL